MSVSVGCLLVRLSPRIVLPSIEAAHLCPIRSLLWRKCRQVELRERRLALHAHSAWQICFRKHQSRKCRKRSVLRQLSLSCEKNHLFFVPNEFRRSNINFWRAYVLPYFSSRISAIPSGAKCRTLPPNMLISFTNLDEMN